LKKKEGTMYQMEILMIAIFALFGIVVGSFLNVCIDRLPVKSSLIFPASHCDNCGQKLVLKDLIPIISYLWLRGRCRYCNSPIPQRVMWIEAGTGIMFALFYHHYGLSLEFAVITFYSCIFIVIMVIDIDHKLILNKITYPVAAIALITNIFMPHPGIVDSLIGGAIGFFFFLIPAIIRPAGMGWGDVKMAGLIGLVVGFPHILIAIVIAAVGGGLVAITLLLVKVKKRKEAIPFGPFLSLAAIATLIWGTDILNWYMGLIV